MRVELQIDSDVGRKEVAPKGPVIRIGRDPDCEVRFDDARFPKVSGVHAQLEEAPGGVSVRHLSRSNATLLNGAPIDGAVSLKRGDVLRLGYTGPEVRLVDYWLPLGSAPAKKSSAASPQQGMPAAEPSTPEPSLQIQDRKAPPTLWFMIGGVLTVSALVAAYLFTLKPPRDDGPTNLSPLATKPADVDTAKPITPAPSPARPSSGVVNAERLQNAVVALGIEIDGVFRIQGSALVVTPELVVTTADMARFINDSIAVSKENKDAPKDKPVQPAVRHADGMVRLRRVVADPKYDPLRPESTLAHNLAIGVLDRSLTEISLWPSLKTAAAALVALPTDNPGAVDAIAWDGKGVDPLAFKRREWTASSVHGVDAGPDGEFVAFHLTDDLPGSAAGGAVFKDGRWRGLLFRHPSPSDPGKKIWKFVTLKYAAPRLIEEGN